MDWSNILFGNYGIGGNLLNLKFGFGRGAWLRQNAIEVAVDHGDGT
jgi:hypothetical protein